MEVEVTVEAEDLDDSMIIHTGTAFVTMLLSINMENLQKFQH